MNSIKKETEQTVIVIRNFNLGFVVLQRVPKSHPEIKC